MNSKTPSASSKTDSLEMQPTIQTVQTGISTVQTGLESNASFESSSHQPLPFSPITMSSRSISGTDSLFSSKPEPNPPPTFHIDMDNMNFEIESSSSGSRHTRPPKNTLPLDNGNGNDHELHKDDNHQEVENESMRSVPICECARPSWTRISSFIVRNAPCFLCFSHPLDVSATDRAILFRLNILCGFFALVQVGLGVLICVILFSEFEERDDSPGEFSVYKSYIPNLWNLNSIVLVVACIGLVLLISVLLVRRVIREVNLIGAMRYYWELMWILPIEIFLVICLFDYHRVTAVWIKHWWQSPSFSWFRETFCLPGTADTKCNAPGIGATQWCVINYNATDCADIQDSAQANMKYAFICFYIVNAIVGLCLVFLLFLTIHALEDIITEPIIQKSRESNIPAWFAFPIVGCLLAGCSILYSPLSVLRDDSLFWIGIIYLVSAGTFFIAALLGWFISAYSVLNRRDKRHKQIAVMLFIFIIILTILSVASIFTVSLIYSVNLVQVDFEDEKDDIACFLDASNSCTNCDKDYGEPMCPEWTTEDILSVFRTTLKQCSSLAAIFLLHAFGALRFGFLLRAHVSIYEVEYV